MRFVPLASLGVRHNYYPDGRCPDFDLRPTPAMGRLLRNHRMVMRRFADRVEIGIGVDDEAQVLIPPRPDTGLDFQLELRNHRLPLFTSATPVHTVRIVARRSPDPEVELPIAAGEPAPPDEASTAVFASVVIPFDTSATSNGSMYRSYRVTLDPSEVHWAYYCVTDLPPANGTLAVVDAATTDPIGFGPDGGRDLVAVPDPGDPVAGELARRFPDSRRLRFLSDQPVTHRADPARDLQLRLDGQRLVGPVPHPMPALTARLDHGGLGASCDAIHQVVTFALDPPDPNSTPSNGG